jgi:MFS family permease
MEWKKGLISGIIAGIVMLIIGSAFMMIPGVTEWYTEKFPEMVAPTAMSIMTVGVVLSGIFMGLVYSVVNSAIPGEGARKGLNYGIMVWLLAGLTWPIMMMDGFCSSLPVDCRSDKWINHLFNSRCTTCHYLWKIIK